MKPWIFLILFFLQLFPLAWATEVDNFTDRELPLSDSREALNSKMNGLISLSIDATNLKYDCEENVDGASEYFYKKLDKKIGGFFWARYENEIEADPLINKRHFNKKQSIYKNLSIINGFAFKLAKLGSVVNIGNNYVGSDKLGHFIGIGKLYFDKMRKKQQSLESVMLYGQNSEETFFGVLTTGVFSYGDLVANYEGLRFWQGLLEGNEASIKCVQGGLTQVREFDWLDFVNDAWDESINCSEFRTSKIKAKVIKEIGQECPIRPLGQDTILRYANTPLKIINN